MKYRFTRDHHPAPGSAAHLNPLQNPYALVFSESKLCPCNILLLCEHEAVMCRFSEAIMVNIIKNTPSPKTMSAHLLNSAMLQL